MKRCSRCGIDKPVSEFHKNKAQSDGYEYYCKKCASEYNKNDKRKERNNSYYQRNKEKCKQKHRDYYHTNKKTILLKQKEKYQMSNDKTKRRKGLSKLSKRTGHDIDTLESFYSKKIIEQNGKCAICGIDESSITTRLHIDHNHKTGELRALLCGRCNAVLGSLDESIELLDRMKTFLISQQ